MSAQENASMILKTPIGRLHVEASPRGLCRLVFAEGGARRESRGTPAARQQLARAVRQLREYFRGQRTRFELPLDLTGTPHQQRVWRGLLGVPFGRTLSYGEMAARLGTPGGARAVGRACATNPVSIVVPCHRIVGGDGRLHGYGGGLWRKQRLLELEGAANASLPGFHPAGKP
jgi:methylated-DNA-[protein]-cysteine S-methyltransferase